MPRWPHALVALLAACTAEHDEPTARRTVQTRTPPAPDPAALIQAEPLRRYTEALADDRMQGRGTGTEGGRLATQWVETQMETLGFKPELQPVPLLAYSTSVRSMQVGGTTPQSVLHSELPDGAYKSHWPLLNAGFGIVAPEYDWDDYAGLDVTGAVVFVKAGEPTTPGLFGDGALTVHGRWTTKLERARERGAAGCLIVHDRVGAGYPWHVVQSSFSGDRFAQAPGPDHSLALWGWLASPPEAGRIEADFDQRTRAVREHNVLAHVGSGQSPLVVVMAHWDHLGAGPEGVFNGAMDNASGVAALLVLAQAVQARHNATPLQGTVVFAATAAEEVGLHGSRVLAASLTDAPAVAAVNLDGMNVGPATPTVELVAHGFSTLDDVFATVVAAQGRRALPDQSPASGAAFRSDHLPFAERGVPVLYPQPGFSEVVDPNMLSFAAERTRRYHTTADEFDPTWTFAGAVADTLATYAVVLDLADGEIQPRVRTDASLGQ